jgi:hypothetical protein
MLGPRDSHDPLYAERSKQLEDGELDEYTCLYYSPGDKPESQIVTEVKVKDLRK